MRAPCFLDTNILIYAAAGRHDAPEKHNRSVQIIRDEDIRVSTQVVGEFLQVSRKKYLSVMGIAEINLWADRLLRLKYTDIDQALIRGALFVAERYEVSFWDAALVAASERLGAEILYTEDLSHRQKYGSVTAINPFRAQ